VAVVSRVYDTRAWRDFIRPTVLERDRYACRRCGVSAMRGQIRTRDLLVDHIVPRAHGGGDQLDNLQTLCAPCSGRKDGPRVGENARSRGMRSLS
jgi:5-methylcytosine-specific restriction endonuclease McrA